MKQEPGSGTPHSRLDEAIGPAEREWVEESVRSWVEVYKKSATTLVLLDILAEHGPAPAAQVRTLFEERTGWSITERGLYRTLQRLAGSGLLAVTPVSVPGTGAKRKDFSLTAAGHYYLRRLQEEIRQ